MTKKYLLVTDAVPEQLEPLGLPGGHWTPLGTLVERPAFDIEAAMDRLDRAMRPRNGCVCDRRAIVHKTNCPMFYCTT